MRFDFFGTTINTAYPVFVIGFWDNGAFQAFDSQKHKGKVPSESLRIKSGHVSDIELTEKGNIKAVSISCEPGYVIGRGSPGRIAIGNTQDQAKNMLTEVIQGVKKTPKE